MRATTQYIENPIYVKIAQIYLIESLGMKQSPEVTGGSGFTFEDKVIAIYFSDLLAENSVSGFPSCIIDNVALQQANSGHPLDDIIVEGKTKDGDTVCVSLQAKRSLTISSSKSNTDFRDIIVKAYETMQKPDFQNDKERLGCVIEEYTNQESKRNLKYLCDTARSYCSVEPFIKQLANLSQSHQNIFDDIRNILKAYLNKEDVDTEAYQLARHFIMLELEVMSEGANDEKHAINNLRNCLHPDDSDRAFELWNRLQVIANEAKGRAAKLDHATLLSKLYGAFRFKGARSLQSTLEHLESQANSTLKDISNQIAGVAIHRTESVEKIEAQLKQHQCVQIIGAPGVGKSAIFRALAERYLAQGPILVLKSDRLEGTGWTSYAQASGLGRCDLEKLLTEIACAGFPILFIDGLDRVETTQQSIIRDILNTIFSSFFLKAQWKIVASLRDNGVEALRTWLPNEFFESSIATTEVMEFNEDEAKELANAKPQLRSLLFHEDEFVRGIARRPFFANILSRTVQAGNIETPKSEIDLINDWLDSYGVEADAVCNVLIELAKRGAETLGRLIAIDNMDSGILRKLKNDAVLKDIKKRHFVAFSHDIFFEWSFFQLLVRKNEAWIEELKIVREPPALGRVVELLSQEKYIQNENWEKTLNELEQSELRSQWTRSWLLGPLSLPGFLSNSENFTRCIFNDTKRLTKLAVWFQAEKAQPNPFVLDGTIEVGNVSRVELIRIADQIAWPANIRLWRNLCLWLLNQVDVLPKEAIPYILTIFEIWQYQFNRTTNNVSEPILIALQTWLIDIEDRFHSETFEYDPGDWKGIANIGKLARRLRDILLLSASLIPEFMQEYLVRMQGRKTLRKDVFSQLLSYSGPLSRACAKDFVDLVLVELKNELPEEKAKRESARRFWSGFSQHDRENLALNESERKFFPAAPTREPFASLFYINPSEGLRLVRELTNHAITAWRQFSAFNGITPIPLTLNFPWGKQSFWGDKHVYLWFRRLLVPDVLASALMALENWAFSEIENGRDADDVIKDILFGQESCAVLGIAVTIMLASHKVSYTTLPLAVCQHIWQWDINRYALDATGSHANFMGFRDKDKHFEALQHSNNRSIRQADVRCLTPLFILNRDVELSRAAQIAIQAFPENLPFGSEEERQDQAHIASLLHAAKYWAEEGKPENCVITPTEVDSQYKIEVHNPKAKEPEVILAQERQAELFSLLRPLSWVQKCLKYKVLDPSLSLKEAIKEAQRLDSVALFEVLFTFHMGDGQRQAVVAGIAAIALSYPSDLTKEELDWARDVILRAAATPEQSDIIPESELPYHPCLYAVYGCAALAQNPNTAYEAKCQLIRLMGHPYEQIKIEAARSGLNLVNIDFEFSYFVLDTWLKLTIVEIPIDNTRIFDSGESLYKSHAEKIISNALDAFAKSQTPKALNPFPDPWVFSPPRFQGLVIGDQEPVLEPIWHGSNIWVRYNLIARILEKFPVEQFMLNSQYRESFLGFCDDMLHWFLERIQPHWERNGEKGDKGSSFADNSWLFEFLLPRFLACVSQYLSVSEVQNLILTPIFVLQGDAAISFIKDFIDSLSRLMMDSKTVATSTIPTIQACIDWVLKGKGWQMARERDGEPYGRYLPEVIEIMFFVQVKEKADKSARFANDDWSEIGIILPIIKSIMIEIGDIPSVIGAFLTLCERAITAFPSEIFIDLILHAVKKQPGIPIGWLGTTIPERIATLIQVLGERDQVKADSSLAKSMLEILDLLVDMGDRRAAALQKSELFRNIRN